METDYIAELQAAVSEQAVNWVANTGTGAAKAGVTADPVDALNAANRVYALAAAEAAEAVA